MRHPRKGFDSDSSCSGTADIFCPSMFLRLSRHGSASLHKPWLIIAEALQPTSRGPAETARASSLAEPSLYLLYHTQTTTHFPATAPNTAPYWSTRAEPFSPPVGASAPPPLPHRLSSTLASLAPLICSGGKMCLCPVIDW